MKIHRWVTSCLGLGLIPLGPGTWGSLGACVFWVGLFRLGLPFWMYLGLLLFFCVFGVWAIKAYEAQTQSEDASEIVIDEWVGMGIALAFSSFFWPSIVLAFVLFRFFDISKILGIRYFDQRHWGGWGVMLDDVLAGIYAGVLVLLVDHFLLSEWLYAF